MVLTTKFNTLKVKVTEVKFLSFVIFPLLTMLLTQHFNTFLPCLVSSLNEYH